MGTRIEEILSWSGSDNPGTLTNLARLMNHGELAGVLSLTQQHSCKEPLSSNMPELLSGNP